MKPLSIIFLVAMPFAVFASDGDRQPDGPQIYAEFTAVQNALEKQNASAVKATCAKTRQSDFFCSYARFVTGDLSAMQFVKSLPAERDGAYRLFQYDESLTHELQERKLPNPYGAGPAFVYIDQVALLSYALPRDALAKLLTIYRHSEGYWAEHIKSTLSKMMFEERFRPNFDELEKQYPAEVKTVRAAYEAERAARKAR